MDTEQLRTKMSQLQILQLIPAEARDGVLTVFGEVSETVSYPADDTLMHAGYLSFDTGYVVLDGVVSIELPSGTVDVAAPALLGEMSQFRSADTRSATVRAKNDVTALEFSWDDLYAKAESTLTDTAALALRTSIERQVWERYPYRNIQSLGLFGDLNDDLKLRVCLPFLGLAEPVTIKGTDILFRQGSNCKSTGYIVGKGNVNLARKNQGEKIVAAPDILGIFPSKSDEEKQWTATASASGVAEILKFSWEKFAKQLVKRLTKEEQQAFVQSVKNNAAKHFWN